MHPASMQAIAIERGNDLHMDAAAARRAREARPRPAGGYDPDTPVRPRRGVRSMMPYDGYRLYQAERPKSAAETRYADDQAGRVAQAIGALFRGMTPTRRTVRAVRVAQACRPAPGYSAAHCAAEPATRC